MQDINSRETASHIGYSLKCLFKFCPAHSDHFRLIRCANCHQVISYLLKRKDLIADFHF